MNDFKNLQIVSKLYSEIWKNIYMELKFIDFKEIIISEHIQFRKGSKKKWQLLLFLRSSFVFNIANGVLP